MDDIFFIIVIWLIVLGGGLGAAGYFVFWLFRRLHQRKSRANDNPVFSFEDIVGQLWYVLGMLFLGLALSALNRDFGKPFEEHHVLLITSVLAFSGAYIRKLVYLVPIGMVSLFAWYWMHLMWIGDSDAVMHDGAAFATIPFGMIAFYCIGRILEQHKKYARFSFIHILMTLVFTIILLFLFSTKEGIEEYARFFDTVAISSNVFVYISMILSGIAAITLLGYSAAKKHLFIRETIGLLVVGITFALPMILPFTPLLEDYSLNSTGIAWAFYFNVITLLLLLGTVFMGYVKRQAWYINLGSFALFVFIITKYFDWFFTFLDKSVFFIGAGILFFIVGWLMERGRRYLISEVTHHG